MGSPNCGKSTIFNAFTGLSQKVGNYPGVTVEGKDGVLSRGEKSVRILDLPGLYGFTAMSPDEAVVSDVLSGKSSFEKRPDAVLFVLDGSALHRSLGLLASVLSEGLPTAIAVTMYDEIKTRGARLDVEKLSSMLGVPVFPVIGHRGIGIDEAATAAIAGASWPIPQVDRPLKTAADRAGWSDSILAAVYEEPAKDTRLTRKIDAVVLHPIVGPLIFFVVMAFLFQAIFTWAGPLMDLFSGACSSFGAWVESWSPPGLMTQLLVHGVIDGVGAVVVFLPQIMILFFLIHLLEAVGYMSRAAFLADRVMGFVGLQGRSFVALLSCHACAVPGIMATRSIPSQTDRLKTMLVAPFMACSARLPVYALLIGAFVPDLPVFGPLRSQGVLLLALYVIGALTAFLSSWVLSNTIVKGNLLPFYMELPPYRWPTMKNVFLAMWHRVSIFIGRAGRVILPASILLWGLMAFPRADAGVSPSAQIEQSIAGRMGKAIEPMFAPAGFDWRINIGIIASLAAREVVVSTLAQIYGIEGDNEDGLVQMLKNAKDPKTGRKLMDFPTAMALIAFFIFALQCVSTLAIMRRETGTWKWPAFAFAYMSVMAWVAAVGTYQVSCMFLS
ncbi:MAG: ferrous iron transporter B [Elusimicrobia bacterium]|nr:MAG: ferrous iron transporter B [Elusimicrobiota bacterium]